ncbi:MAG TPA: hypothetical protein VKA00_06955 [Trueperaceae bacterium]|nr:hypothetical protein [Trueperaceae bacterium]
MAKPVIARKRTCDRCREETGIVTRSYFNGDQVCPRCDALERAHPLFMEARRLEEEAVLRGNYEFRGAGVPADLVAQSKRAAKRA